MDLLKFVWVDRSSLGLGIGAGPAPPLPIAVGPLATLGQGVTDGDGEGQGSWGWPVEAACRQIVSTCHDQVVPGASLGRDAVRSGLDDPFRLCLFLRSHWCTTEVFVLNQRLGHAPISTEDPPVQIARRLPQGRGPQAHGRQASGTAPGESSTRAQVSRARDRAPTGRTTIIASGAGAQRAQRGVQGRL